MEMDRATHCCSRCEAPAHPGQARALADYVKELARQES